MFNTVYYVIRPKNALNERLDALDADWACLLTDAILWSRRESPEISVAVSTWVILREIEVKLLFMLDMASEYLSWTEPAQSDFQMFLYELLELPAIKAETFDKWWSLERIDGLASTFEAAEDRLTKHAIEAAVIPSIDGASEWIEFLKQEKK